ncbi:MAG: DUF3179 domain-containing protein, partial [Anaerolineales bacterium]
RTPYRLLPGELILAANPDDIPAVFANDSLFVDAEAGSEEWHDEEEIVAVEINGQARAYPIRLLSLHEIVNDTVGGQPIAVTWCPLCYSALVFSRVVEGQELTFGVSGYLFKNNLVMFDHQTNSLWSQLLFQSIKGGYNGQPLQVLHGVHTTWGAWKDLYPETTVLSARQMGRRDEIFDPYALYYHSGATGIGGENPDPRLDGKTLIIGLTFGGESIAYPFDLIREANVINAILSEAPFLLVYNPELNSVTAFDRATQSGVLTFQQSPTSSMLIDMETSSTWDPQLGQAIDGPLAGEQLTRLTAPLAFWFAWADLHPETVLVLDLP